LSIAAGARALSYRKKLDAKAITSSYGYCSKVYKSAVKVFCRVLTKPKSERTRVFLRGMKKLVSYATLFQVRGALVQAKFLRSSLGKA
jgi:hypothetical protein